MARLLSWPIGLGRIAYQRLSGPRTVGGASNESMTGFVQTVSSAFGLWRYQLSLPAMRGPMHRLYRQMVTALHGGANAVRVQFNDPDIMSFREAGIDVDNAVAGQGVTWSNGLPWSNGQNWQLTRPPVTVTHDAALGATIIRLADEHWGHSIASGWIGFYPLHFGKYEITQVIDAGAGEYRIWPPLRKALIGASTFATLNPVMAMKLESESGGSVQRGVAVSEGNTLTLIEVQDQYVRTDFTD